MGCDIFVSIEQRDKKTNTWKNLSLYTKGEDGSYNEVGVYDIRDYELFSVLAGVRGSTGSFVSPRGIPDDVSDEVKEAYENGINYWHTPTWYDYCELKGYIYMLSDATKELYKQKIEIEQLKAQIKQITTFNIEEESSYEFEDLLEDSDEEYSTVESLNDFMAHIKIVLEAYDIYFPEPGDIRVIMWFNS